DHGPRTLSRVYRDRPYVLEFDGRRLSVAYRSGESDSNMFGGNSNWRGPVWLPVAYLLVESLRRFHRYYGDDFKVECPTRSGQYLTIWGVAEELGRRMTRLFLRDEKGRRAAFGGSEKLQSDPHFRDYLTFNEYFDGDDGRGLGTLHQGWTCMAAVMLLQPCSPETWQDETVCPLNAEGDQATRASPTGAASTVGMERQAGRSRGKLFGHDGRLIAEIGLFSPASTHLTNPVYGNRSGPTCWTSSCCGRTCACGRTRPTPLRVEPSLTTSISLGVLLASSFT